MTDQREEPATTLDDLIRAARDWGIEEAGWSALPSTLEAHRAEVEEMKAAIEREAAPSPDPYCVLQELVLLTDRARQWEDQPDTEEWDEAFGRARAVLTKANLRQSGANLAAAPSLLQERDRLDVEREAREVMRLLGEHGPSIVPHLLDSDDNPGQRLREALAKATHSPECISAFYRDGGQSGCICGADTEEPTDD